MFFVYYSLKVFFIRLFEIEFYLRSALTIERKTLNFPLEQRREKTIQRTLISLYLHFVNSIAPLKRLLPASKAAVKCFMECF